MDERLHEPPRYPLPEVIQPDPMLEPERNLFGTAMVYVGAAAIVMLVLYGLSRPEVPQQLASEPSAATQTAPAGGASAPPTTTGQSNSGQTSGAVQAKPETGKGQPAHSDSSNDTGSNNQPRQQAQ